MKPMTNAQHKDAAIRDAKARMKAGGAQAAAIPGTNKKMSKPLAPGVKTLTGTSAAMATPDYFGIVPNYANSPLPTSVSIQGDGLDSYATATVSGGAVTAITVVNGGSGYTFANVVVIGGGGSGATGAATIMTGTITAIAVTNGGSGYDTVPGMRKFVDTLPGLTPAGVNNLGQYLPVAVPDTTTFAGSPGNPAADYYEIALVQYTQKLHSDLPATTLRGYVQIETPVIAAMNPPVSKHVQLFYPDGVTPILNNAGNPVFAVDNPQYLGPIIASQKDRPVRVKFDNYLSKGTGGDLFIPVDPTDMGAGMGPKCSDGTDMVNGGCTAPATMTSYSQNRATLHLHGGVTPWISDGTPNQWTTPAGATETYPKGVSVRYVPDQWYDAAGNDIPLCDGQTTCTVTGATTDPGPGSMTFYYTNQQSARLMFYHDHAYGITRLNVYAGEAAGYLVSDPVEQTLVNGGTISGTNVVVPAGTIPADQVPLVIQDKVFVPSPAQLAAEDPTWNTTAYGGYGNLWFPHTYMTNQNPGDAMGANAMGRWDYGPWFWPPNVNLQHGQVPNPKCTTPGVQSTCPIGQNAYNPGTPNPSLVPESFVDTPVVNGTAYPTLNLQPKAYRFRILNASNDRTLNLQLYYAGTETAAGAFQACTGSVWSGTTLVNNGCSGEVPMVPAVRNTPGTTGYVYPDELDGRLGGVPDIRAAGPQMIQIGTEGGFLSKPVVLPNMPVGYNYNRRDIVVLNVSTKTLMLGPAERADVIVDLSTVPAGSTLIMYNDSPAPVPAFDMRNDYYTFDQDQVMTGGAPTTQPGYGPNTRTIMQIQVAGTAGAGANLAALNTALPAAYGQVQAAPVVPEQGYDQAFGTSSPADPYIRIGDMQTTFKTGTVTTLTLSSPGAGYLTPPAVAISGGGGAGATAQAVLVGTGVISISLTNPGTGYTAAPLVTIDPPAGCVSNCATATAVATISTSVAGVNMTNNGTGYTSPPTVTFTKPTVAGGQIATGTAVLAPSGVASVAVTAGGSYTVAPQVQFNGGTGGATATAVLGAGPVGSVNVTTAGSYTSVPTVIFSSGTAAATATLMPTTVFSVSLVTQGSPYISAPTVTFTGGGATTAASAQANLAATGSVGAVNVTSGGSLYTTPPTLFLSAPQTAGGIQATARVSAMSPVGLGSVSVTNGGRCNAATPVPTVTISSANGIGGGATAVATVGGNRRSLRITGVTLTNPGSGYTVPPTVSFGTGNCSGASARANLLPSSVLSIAVTNPGSGYTSAPRVTFNGGGGGGTGAAATTVLGKLVTSITLISGGAGYTSVPVVTLSGPQWPGGQPATASTGISPTGIASVAVTNGGSYTTAPGVSFSGTGGGAATAVLGPAPVASVTINTPGSYASAPTVTFVGGTGTATAAGTATLLPSGVASVTMGNSGAGYSAPPLVFFSGGGGSSAAGTATLAPGPLVALTLVGAGAGYAAAPNVTIAPPQTAGTTAQGAAGVGVAGSVGSLIINNPGSGYVFTPTVTLAPPPGGGTQATAAGMITTLPVTLTLQPKGIQELFEVEYGRMNATMSVEIPNTNGTNQTTIPYGYVDPPTEIIDTNSANALVAAGGSPIATLPDGTQIWKFTHNGVDTHSVHFHMFNLELINRVGWDGMIRPPEPNEMGWKETIRMNPLEDALVAIKPIVPALPWALPNSIRPLDVTAPLGTSGPQYTNIDPAGNPVTVVNHLVNMAWEYVFHCHLLGHEENDMMRPMVFGVSPASPTGVSATAGAAGSGNVTIQFTDNSVNETGFTLQRSTDGLNWASVDTKKALMQPDPTLNADLSVNDPGASTGTVWSYIDPGLTAGTTYYYRVIANDVVGDTHTAGYPTASVDSVPSSVATATAQ
jgi:FtsP/CotA-like multicopper oxidase with cupredoxin domain